MKKFIIFSLNGIPGVFVYYLIYFSFVKILDINYIFTSIIGGIINIIISFLVHRKWTFKTNKKKIEKQFVVYFCYSVLNTTLLYILVNNSPLGKIWSQIVLTIILSVINYFVTKKIMTEKKPDL